MNSQVTSFSRTASVEMKIPRDRLEARIDTVSGFRFYPPIYPPQQQSLHLLAQNLTQMLQSLSHLASHWGGLLLPPPPVELPRPRGFVPRDTDYGWPRIQGYQGHPLNDDPPAGYRWSERHDQHGVRHVLTPNDAPGLEMKEVAPGKFLPVLNQKFRPLPPYTKTRYGMNEFPPPPPEGYEWTDRFPGERVLTPLGMPHVNLAYTGFGWIAQRHFELPIPQ